MHKNSNGEAMSFFRIKTEWTSEMPSGDLGKVKTEELVMAVNYSDAENAAYQIAEHENRSQYDSINVEIIKTKISDILFNDILAQDEELVGGLVCNFFEEGEESGVGLYSVKVVFISMDEKTGKEKHSTDTIYVPAESNSDATKKIEAYLKNSMTDYVIRDTKFDKAEAIYWPTDIHQQKTKAA